MRDGRKKFNVQVFALIASYALTGASLARAEDDQTLPIDSVHTSLAIVTGKEGIASGLAHRHIIVARGVVGQVKIMGGKDLAASQVKAAVADLEFSVDQMVVDSEVESSSIVPVLVAAGAWDQSHDKVEPSNSAKVRENMLAQEQLDGKKFPKISGHGTLSQCQVVSADAAQCSLSLTLTIKGVAIKRDIQAQLTGTGGQLEARFSLPMKFSDFGMKPYSAMLGAIRVSDAMLIAGVVKLKP
jgi:hypothetical protein